jgi:hypothetical protein
MDDMRENSIDTAGKHAITCVYTLILKGHLHSANELFQLPITKDRKSGESK